MPMLHTRATCNKTIRTLSSLWFYQLSCISQLMPVSNKLIFQGTKPIYDLFQKPCTCKLTITEALTLHPGADKHTAGRTSLLHPARDRSRGPFDTLAPSLATFVILGQSISTRQLTYLQTFWAIHTSVTTHTNIHYHLSAIILSTIYNIQHILLHTTRQW